MTTEQKIKKLTYWNEIAKEKIVLLELLAKIEELEASELEPSATIAVLGTTTNLPAVAGSYADLAAARTSVASQNVAVEARLDLLDAKVDEIITKLKTAGLITA